jgi:7-cyano-7-deazaguanine tRNA-ribosyltransferase
MSFELRDRDLLGRIGRLTTKGGTLETPAFMPVVNPVTQTIPPRRMREEFGCDIIITNAYLIRKHFGDLQDLKVHAFLDYDGVVATDSGAYQILIYGDVEVSPEEIIGFQQRIGSDIAVILDIPTGWDVPRSRVEWTVEETLRRAKAALPLIEGDETLWVGPVQGGAHLDLVERSAWEIGSMPFHIHALGSPTEVMESYRFTVLVDMIMAAKRNLPPDRPLHLFGAGHPMMFSLAVALGCDLFDSAAYALYAREGRYLTPLGTRRLENLSYLPCSCPVCRRHNADEFKEMLKGERVKALTEHNLHVTMAEIETVKQAVAEGATLESALRRLYAYRDDLEKASPAYKGRGMFYFGPSGLARPQITRHLRRLETQFLPFVTHSKLLLVSAPSRRPFSQTREYKALKSAVDEGLGKAAEDLQICFYAAPFGVVPVELAETYPLSQFEVSEPLDVETLEFAAENVGSFVAKSSCREVALYAGTDPLDEVVEAKCREVCEGDKKELTVAVESNPWRKEALERLVAALKGEP